MVFLAGQGKRVAYFTASFGILLVMTFQSYDRHKQFFPMMVSLYNSREFLIALTNGALAALFLISYLITKLAFGKITAEESRRVTEKFFYFFVESCVGLTYFRSSLSAWVTSVVIMMGVWKLFHQLAYARLTSIEQEMRITRLGFLRYVMFLGLLMHIDVLGLFYFIDHVKREGVGVYLLLLLEFSLMLVHSISVCCKLILHCVELMKGGHWRRRGVLRFYVEILLEVTNCLLYFGFFGALMQASLVPFHLIRELLVNVRRAFKTCVDFTTYTTLMRKLQNVEDPTEEELQREGNCSICYDEMTNPESCKKLPCGHIFHEQCLARWLERNNSCPYCRQNISVLLNKKEQGQQEAAAVAAAAVARNNNNNNNPAAAGNNNNDNNVNGAGAAPPLNEPPFNVQPQHILEQLLQAQQQQQNNNDNNNNNANAGGAAAENALEAAAERRRLQMEAQLRIMNIIAKHRLNNLQTQLEQQRDVARTAMMADLNNATQNDAAAAAAVPAAAAAEIKKEEAGKKENNNDDDDDIMIKAAYQRYLAAHPNKEQQADKDDKTKEKEKDATRDGPVAGGDDDEVSAHSWSKNDTTSASSTSTAAAAAANNSNNNKFSLTPQLQELAARATGSPVRTTGVGAGDAFISKSSISSAAEAPTPSTASDLSAPPAAGGGEGGGSPSSRGLAAGSRLLQMSMNRKKEEEAAAAAAVKEKIEHGEEETETQAPRAAPPAAAASSLLTMSRQGSAASSTTFSNVMTPAEKRVLAYQRYHDAIAAADAELKKELSQL